MKLNNYIKYFPHPYEDESIKSIIARYHRHVRNKKLIESYQELLGSAIPSESIPKLKYLFENTRLHDYYSFEDLLEKHSVIPFYTAFFSTNDRMPSISRNYHDNKLTFIEDNYCWECAKEDIARYDEPYWHRSHQIYGVKVCHIHGSYLHKMNDLGRYSVCYLDEKNLVRDSVTNNYSFKDYNSFIGYSDDVATLLRENFRYNLSDLRDIYMEKIKTLGLCKSGQIKKEKLKRKIRELYSSDHLKQFNTNMFTEIGNTLELIYHNVYLENNTMINLIIIRLLFGSFFNLFYELRYKRQQKQSISL